MIISGLTRHWFVEGPKVAVVVVSVFNTLNTIDCRVGGIFLKDAGIRLDSEKFEVKPGEGVCLHRPLNVVKIEHGSKQHICILCFTGVAILQLIKSRYLEVLSQRQLSSFQRLEQQPLKAEEMTLLIADVLLQGLLCCSLNTQPLNRPLFPQ